jgi:hypothetical protein
MFFSSSVRSSRYLSRARAQASVGTMGAAILPLNKVIELPCDDELLKNCSMKFEMRRIRVEYCRVEEGYVKAALRLCII